MANYSAAAVRMAARSRRAPCIAFTSCSTARSGLRELAAAGLVIEADGRFTVTSPGTRTSATATNC